MAGTLLNNTIDKTDANQQLASTINQGGLLMRMAKNQGSQQAGSRGLMNSSIGNEASQRAIVAAAQPLALQNAQFAQNKDLNQQQSDLTLKRDAVQQGYNKENMGLQFGYTTKLNNQQNQATTARDATLFGYDQKNKATDFANSLKTMSEQQKNDLAKLNNQNTQQTALAAQQQQYTLTNTAKQVAANTQGMYLDAINGLTSTFGDQVAVINASSMKAEDKKNSINSLISAQNSMLKFYQSTYQNMSTIKDDWVNVDVNTLPTGSIAQLK